MAGSTTMPTRRTSRSDAHPPKSRLSKSRIVSGLQCERRLWLETYCREAMEIDAASQAAFDTGHEVGELARSLYGPGSLVEHVHDIDTALAETAALLACGGKRRTLFEPAFRHSDVVVRADVLKPVPGGYDLIEVKASTSVKDYHLTDCAIQAWVIEQAGIPLKHIRLAHLDNTFVYRGDADYHGLLVAEDVTGQVRELVAGVAPWVRRFKKVLRADEPAIATGDQCHDPYPCPFFAHCRAQQPAGPKYPLSLLPHGGKLARTLSEAGYLDLRKVPAARLDKPLHQRIHAASISGRAFLDPAAARVLARLGYPRYHLDFETIAFAVPRWAGTRPYQQIPFQWSCHIEQPDGSFNEHAFLDLSGEPPMRAFAESLLATLGRRGPIMVYNQSFEASRVRELATLCPDLALRLRGLIDRMVDLLPITRAHYYHPAMMGSWSLKAVLPTIAPELAYDRLGEVADGGQAQLAYVEAIHPQTSSERRAVLDTALRRYCANDTLALIRLAAVLARG